jgi:hypothetical protein
LGGMLESASNPVEKAAQEKPDHHAKGVPNLITCHVKYVIDPYQLTEFEAYAKAWLGIVERLGGTHHGYFLPSEGASNIAYCLFSFPSLADYESYRHSAMTDPESTKLVASLVEKKFIVSYERTFLRPLLA